MNPDDLFKGALFDLVRSEFGREVDVLTETARGLSSVRGEGQGGADLAAFLTQRSREDLAATLSVALMRLAELTPPMVPGGAS